MDANTHNPEQTTNSQDGADHARGRRVAFLIQQPQRLVGGLREPSARGMRIPASAVLIQGGMFGILPILRLWMIPLGLALLAEDVPPPRRAFDRLLIWIEHRRPHWLGLKRHPHATWKSGAPSQGNPA